MADLADSNDIELGVLPTTTAPTHEDFLVCFVNSKSGGQKGQIVFAGLTKLTNKSTKGYVHDLATVSTGTENLPGNVIRKFLPEYPRLRVLVCGGDGTMCWVLNAIASLGLSNAATPRMACMPLGTGNDLSRMFGWGTKFQTSQLTWAHVKKVHSARSERFDLWRIKVTIPAEGMTEQVKKWLPPVLRLEHQALKKEEDQVEHAVGVVVEELVDRVANENRVEQETNTVVVETVVGEGVQERTATEKVAEQAAEQAAEQVAEQVKENAPLHSEEKTNESTPRANVYTGHICNYMSIGMTARGAMLFHRERQEHPERFTGPLKNKTIYASKGCGMFCNDCCCHPDVRQRVTLHVKNTAAQNEQHHGDRESKTNEDNNGATFQAIEIPSGLAEVNVLNIQSYSGGVIHTPTRFTRAPSPGDGVVEVVGLTNYVPTSFAVGCCCLCSVSPMKPLAQSSTVRLTIVGDDGDEPVVAQFDGEPFYLPTGAVVEIEKETTPVFVLSLKKKKKTKR